MLHDKIISFKNNWGIFIKSCDGNQEHGQDNIIWQGKPRFLTAETRRCRVRSSVERIREGHPLLYSPQLLGSPTVFLIQASTPEFQEDSHYPIWTKLLQPSFLKHSVFYSMGYHYHLPEFSCCLKWALQCLNVILSNARGIYTI